MAFICGYSFGYITLEGWSYRFRIQNAGTGKMSELIFNKNKHLSQNSELHEKLSMSRGEMGTELMRGIQKSER